MIEITQELEKYGLTDATYEACLADIRGKLNGQLDIDWAEIVDKYHLGIHSDTLRKASQTIFGGAFISEYYREKNATSTNKEQEDYLKALKLEKEEIIKERQKLSDERVDIQRTRRADARKESFLELVERSMAKHIEPMQFIPSAHIDSEEDMIVCLSDLHAGIEIRNRWNTYNTAILQDRLIKYINEIKEIQTVHKSKCCHIVLGGDNISGLIHPNLRLENNENVVEQIKLVTTYIGDFISNLVGDFEEIRVHSVSGNHSRLSPSKEEHLKGEELDALIPFCLAIRFSQIPTVTICEDGYIDNTINSFTTRGGKLFYIVHGDKDTPNNVIKNLTLMTGTKPDGIIMHHRHHNAFDSQYGVKIFEVGCVVGTDNHCIDLRICGEPEQIVIITNEKRVAKCIYDIGLS